MRRLAQIFQSCRYVVGAVAILVLFWLAGPRIAINTSISLPKGFYLIKNHNDDPLKRGDIVLFYEEKINSFASTRGYIREGESIGKKIAAIGGDTVCVDSIQTVVLGKKISESAPQIDSKGRKMDRFYYKGEVPEGNLFLIGEARKSFDSRYYGFINEKSVIATLLPLIVW